MMESILDEGVRFVARRARSIGIILSPSMLPVKTTHTHGLAILGVTNVQTRDVVLANTLNISKVFSSFSTSQIFPMKAFLNCNTTHVVYLIGCTTCQKQYVGCTTSKKEN